MSKAVQRGCLCLLVLVVVAISGSPLALRDLPDDVPEACQDAVTVCVLPALLPYVGLTEDEIFDKLRSTALSEHCSDFTTAGDCVRQEFSGGSCSDLTGTSARKFAKSLEAFDFASNYICKDHFDEVNRNFQCLASRGVHEATQSTCTMKEVDPNNICEQVQTYVDCSTEIVKSKCGEEASTISQELNSKLVEYILEIAMDKQCSASKLTNRLAILKKFLTRK